MRSRPRMLMVSPAWPWPSTTGGLVRIAGILTQMARHFDLTVIAPAGSREPPADLDARFVSPRADARPSMRRLRALMDPRRPYHVAFYRRPEVGHAVREELRRAIYDVVYSHFIYGLEYVDGRVPVIVDQQNVDRVYWGNKAALSAFPASAFAAWNTRKTIRYEMAALPRIWAYVSVSDEDREQTRAYASPLVKHFWVAGNGVDSRRFAPGEGAAADPPNRLTLGYLGSMDLQMNVEAVQRFCLELLPRIRTGLPGVDVQFLVIGRDPAAPIRALASRVPGVTLSGTVDDVVPWLRRVSILVSPLRIGAGTKLKVAEAMACELPVVGTSLAFAGLSGDSGVHFVRADEDDAFVQAVCRLGLDPVARRRIGRQARAFAQEHLEWDAIGDRLSADIRRALDAS